MVELLKEKITGKKVYILGFGREGSSTYRLLRKFFPDMVFTIGDMDVDLVSKHQLNQDEKLRFVLGNEHLQCLEDFDIIIKSPGITFKHLGHYPVDKITSQTDLFLKAFSSRIIGVTGTKGKSTTASLIYHIIKSHLQDVVLAGNIGVPPFDCFDKIGNDSRIVMELSSHQLQYTSSSPHIAILLNIFQEHLDHYLAFEDYRQAKFNIARFQNGDDFFIFPEESEIIKLAVSQGLTAAGIFPVSLTRALDNGVFAEDNKIKFRTSSDNKLLFDYSTGLPLTGEHNLINMAAAAIACYLTGIPSGSIQDAIRTFKGLEHRLEYVGKFQGIHFYNDSIATIPEAAMAAIKAFPKTNTLIAGGFDRGIDYTGFAASLASGKVKNIILLGEAGQRILRSLKDFSLPDKKLYPVNSLEEAVEIAFRVTEKDKTCLLSPAAASYDQFMNFEERGEKFRQLVKYFGNTTA